MTLGLQSFRTPFPSQISPTQSCKVQDFENILLLHPS
jgi:hypothetical protein